MLLKCFQGAAVIDDMVGALESFVSGHLLGEYFFDVLPVDVVAGHDTLDLLFDRDVDDDGEIDEVVEVFFEQQRYDDEAVGNVGIFQVLDLLLDLLPDGGVEDGFEVLELLGILEDAFAQGETIDAAVIGDDGVAPLPLDQVGDGLAGCGEGVCDGIGVDDGDAESGEDFAGGGFSAADAACQSGNDHEYPVRCR